MNIQKSETLTKPASGEISTTDLLDNNRDYSTLEQWIKIRQLMDELVFISSRVLKDGCPENVQNEIQRLFNSVGSIKPSDMIQKSLEQTRKSDDEL